MNSNKRFLVLSLVLLQLMTCTLMSSALTNPDDVEALRNLYHAWNKKPSSWKIDTDPCVANKSWVGIYCNNDKTHVIKLILINQDLTGTISPYIGNLTRLMEMDLSSNEDLGGIIPTEITKLEHLERLFIQNCNLSGIIPPEIGNLTKLQYFGLTENHISGQLPTTIGLLKDIIWLDVAENEISGSLPVSNTADIGAGLDNLTNAIHFHLEENAFSSSIPYILFNTEMQLRHILLNGNELTGSIPSTIGNLIHVEIICLYENQLDGAVPSTISSIVNLTTLQFHENSISGSLPDLSNNTKLQILQIGNNPFEPFEIPTWITGLTNLRFLSMDSANLVGNITIELFRSKPSLTNVSMTSNQLNGTLNLTTTDAPLLIVNLTDNNISNVDKGNYTNALILEGNPYCQIETNGCGSAGDSTIAPAPSPVASDLSICKDPCPSNYTVNPKLLNNCECFLPIVADCEFYAMKLPIITDDNISFIEKLVVTRLNDDGVVEWLLFQHSQLLVVVLESDKISITVFPPIINTSWNLNDANNITYAIKKQDIQLEQIGPMSCEYTRGPYGLQAPKSSLSTGVKIAIGIGVGALGVLLLLVGLYAIRQRKRALKAEKLNKPFASWIAATQEKDVDVPQIKGAKWFSLVELRNFTDNFHAMHELGEGGYGKVYKGITPSGEELAIKRANADSCQGAPEFKKEIEILSRVHHRNLVNLIGFCFEDGEQMLVYEFMPNGTLRDYISGKYGMHMNWETRIKLALESARGIAYLHNEANPSIIHSDIKSNNILLDKKLEAKVADFGLSKLVSDEDMETNLSTNVRGTMGYLDPEYYMTHRITDKSDVYSFGVVLVELITGKPPFQGGRYIVHEVTRTFEKGGIYLVIETLVDPSLTGYKVKDLETLVTLTIHCVKDQSMDRPSMMAVVKELEALALETNMEALTNVANVQPTTMDRPFISLYNRSLYDSTDEYDTSTFGVSGGGISYMNRRHIEPK